MLHRFKVQPRKPNMKPKNGTSERGEPGHGESPCPGSMFNFGGSKRCIFITRDLGPRQDLGKALLKA